MTRKTEALIARLVAAGMSVPDAFALRRVERALHRWFELECGTERGMIERDEKTGKPYWMPATSRGPIPRYPIPDREKGARKRLATIMKRYPQLTAYVQPDPRGCALYLLRPGDVPAGAEPRECYTRGIAVCE